MSDYPLLDFADRQRATVGQILASTDDQAEQLERVSKRIAGLVKEFCILAYSQGGKFHAEELRAYVNERVICSPGSADRLLRELRKKCELDYEVVSRAKSLYRVTEVRPGP